jgi:DNA-binding transcriptional regulator YiaG
MKAAELQHLLVQLEVSQVAAARALGVADRTMRRYISGAIAIPKPVAKLLRLVEAGRINLVEVEAA